MLHGRPLRAQLGIEGESRYSVKAGDTIELRYRGLVGGMN